MIKFRIHAIGRLKNTHIARLIADYKERMTNHLDICELELKKTSNLSVDTVKEQEGSLLLRDIPHGACIISMDERGEVLSSVEFARYIEKQSSAGFSSFVFVIGGADGLHDNIRKNSNKIISMGKMTLPHMLARLILVEQLYRAECIMNNHPYHK